MAITEQRKQELMQMAEQIKAGKMAMPTVAPQSPMGILPQQNFSGQLTDKFNFAIGRTNNPNLSDKTEMSGVQGLLVKQAIEQQDPLYQAKLKEAQQSERNEQMASPVSDAPQDKEAWLAQLPPRDAALVKAITDYNYDIYRGLSFKDRERIGSLATMYDPSFSMAEFNVRQKYKQETTSGKIGANIRSYNTVLGHLGSLYDVTENKDLPSSPIKFAEKAERGFANQFQSGGPASLAMANENTAITAVAGELANVFKNSGGTDQEIHNWFSSYDKDASREYKQAWLQKGAELLESRMGAIGYDYERVMGKPYEKDILSPKASQTLTRIKSKGGKSNLPSFATEQEAEASGHKGEAIIAGRRARIE
jgi:hypothetical protein